MDIKKLANPFISATGVLAFIATLIVSAHTCTGEIIMGFTVLRSHASELKRTRAHLKISSFFLAAGN